MCFHQNAKRSSQSYSFQSRNSTVNQGDVFDSYLQNAVFFGLGVFIVCQVEIVAVERPVNLACLAYFSTAASVLQKSPPRVNLANSQETQGMSITTVTMETHCEAGELMSYKDG